MEEKKKFEINDEMLESVSGGITYYTYNGPISVGTKVVFERCLVCNSGKSRAVGVITEIDKSKLGTFRKFRMYCCGNEIIM